MPHKKGKRSPKRPRRIGDSLDGLPDVLATLADLVLIENERARIVAKNTPRFGGATGLSGIIRPQIKEEP